MTKISGQNSEVSSQKLGRGLTLSPLPFALSLVGALLLALCLPADAQQPEKVPRVGFLSGAGAPPAGLRSRHSDKGCAILVMLREKTSWWSIATPKEGPNVSESF